MATESNDQNPQYSALVSVVIPCFNQARFLPDAINSLRTQTHRNTEIIVIDDASTDSTRDVAASFSEVVLIRHDTNGGLANARNSGLKVATGEYVVFLDADDWLLPDALHAGLRCICADPRIGFVFGSFHYVRLDGTPIRRREALPDTTDIYGALLARNFIAMIATVMFRRSAIVTVGGLDVRLKASEDYDLLLRIARERPVLHHSAEIACYRIHPDNMSKNPALMLRTSVRALTKQRLHARRNEKWFSNYREGQRFWRTWYGGLLFNQVLLQLKKTGTLLHAARNVGVLLRYVAVSDFVRWCFVGTSRTAGSRR